MRELAPSLLLVDDDPAVLRALRRTIAATHPQWRLLEARDGLEALAVLELNVVHTVIADLQMPRMDGATLLARLAQDHPEILRVVHSSAIGDLGLPTHLAQAQIPKPATPTSLIAVLDWALGGAGSQAWERGSLSA